VTTVEFQVDARTGIATASANPDIFGEFDGTADEHRRIVAAVLAFCQVAKYGLQEP